MKIAILDYDVGNIFSLRAALERLGIESEIVGRIPKHPNFDALILPGVGNFTHASLRLASEHQNLREVAPQLPILGICLGMQLFFERSEEGEGDGLGLIEGDVVRLPRSVKTPQMGWNKVVIRRDHPLLEGLPAESWMYFVHSYYPRPSSQDVVYAESEYGVRFPSIIAKGNVYGTQFHPEKSGTAGKTLLSNFVAIARR